MSADDLLHDMAETALAARRLHETLQGVAITFAMIAWQFPLAVAWELRW